MTRTPIEMSDECFAAGWRGGRPKSAVRGPGAEGEQDDGVPGRREIDGVRATPLEPYEGDLLSVRPRPFRGIL